jgi:hypothetical protein
MFERFKRNNANGDAYDDDRGTVATAERPVTTDDPRYARGDGTTGAVTTRETMRDVRARQRDEYGGINWGAAFFGFLVAVGMAAILAGIATAAGAALGFTSLSQADANANADTIGLVGGIVLIAIIAIAYFCAGYVSGRMSRFDGGRQGAGAWILGVLFTVALGVAGWLFGPDWNVFDKLGLPNVPIDNGTLTTGAAVTGVIVLVVSLLTAMAGGKAGERYHWKVDRLAYRD